MSLMESSGVMVLDPRLGVSWEMDADGPATAAGTAVHEGGCVQRTQTTEQAEHDMWACSDRHRFIGHKQTQRQSRQPRLRSHGRHCRLSSLQIQCARVPQRSHSSFLRPRALPCSLVFLRRDKGVAWADRL